jgi:hypothetical protein
MKKLEKKCYVKNCKEKNLQLVASEGEYDYSIMELVPGPVRTMCDKHAKEFFKTGAKDLVKVVCPNCNCGFKA